MGCYNRINIAKEALKLFLISLPSDCGFQVISFGSNHTWMDDQRELIAYNDDNMERVKQ